MSYLFVCLLLWAEIGSQALNLLKPQKTCGIFKSHIEKNFFQ